MHFISKSSSAYALTCGSTSNLPTRHSLRSVSLTVFNNTDLLFPCEVNDPGNWVEIGILFSWLFFPLKDKTCIRQSRPFECHSLINIFLVELEMKPRTSCILGKLWVIPPAHHQYFNLGISLNTYQ